MVLHSILGDDDVAGAESTTVPSWGSIAIYARRLEMSGSLGPGVPKVRERHFLSLQVLCFCLNTDSFFHVRMRSIDLLLSRLCRSAFSIGFVLARTSPPVGRRPISITPTFARAVHFRFAFPRETNRTEHDSAFVANFPGEAAVIREKLVALLDG